MIDYKKELIEQLKWIDSLIAKVEKSLRSNRQVDGRALRTSKRKKGYQYYLEDQDGNRTYVKVKDMEIVRKVAQKEYDESINKTLKGMRKKLEKFVKTYDVSTIEKEYQKMCEARRRLVEPVILTDEEYVKQWEKDFQGNKNTFPEKGQYLTEKGEYVRSKSEKILADLFYKMGIPYVYEPLLELADGTYVYPDFALLHLRKRKTVYWEHFGLVTNAEYAQKTIHKLNQYETSGLTIGQDLLFSMESDENPLNVKQIVRKIEKNLI